MQQDFAARYAALGRTDDKQAAADAADRSLDEALEHFLDEVLAMHEFLLTFHLPDGSTPSWPTPTSEPVSLAILARRGR